MLHYQKKLPICLNYLVKLYDIGMPDDFKDLNFSRHPLYISFILDFVFLKDFYSNEFTSQRVCSLSHFAECTLSQSFALKNDIKNWNVFAYLLCNARLFCS